MDRDQLKAWLDDGLSLEQIGSVVGRHPSTVSYWLSRHGLKANGRDRHAPKGGIPRDQLESLVSRGHTLTVIAEQLGVSITCVRYWIRRYGLPSPRSVRRERITQAIEEGRRTLHRECPKHGWSVFVIENSGSVRCRRCRVERVTAHRRQTKVLLVKEAGGCCQSCGYDRCLAALEFHHRDPSTKLFQLSLHGITRSIEALRKEAEKCTLLCANCHAEVGAGLLEL
jgi:transposase